MAANMGQMPGGGQMMGQQQQAQQALRQRNQNMLQQYVFTSMMKDQQPVQPGSWQANLLIDVRVSKTLNL